MKKINHKTKVFSVRLPEKLLKNLRKIADKNQHSVNKTIEIILTNASNQS